MISTNNKYINKILQHCKDQRFLIAVLCGVTIGIFSGLALRQYELDTDTIAIISYPGEIFMRGLKLMVLPFVICCIIVGAGTLNIKKNKKIAIYTMLIFVLTSLINVLLGACFVLVFHPGDTDYMNGAKVTSKVQKSCSIVDGFLDIGRNIIPDNLFQATFQQTFTNNVVDTKEECDAQCPSKKIVQYRDGSNTIGIIFFCMIFGCILGSLGPEKQAVIDFFSAAYVITEKMLNGVIWFTPVAVASIICGRMIAVENLFLALRHLSQFIGITVTGLLFYQLVVLQLIYYIIVRKNPYPYYFKCLPPMATVFATATKTVALPLTFQIMDEKLKMNPKITRFILPIGTINLDGTAFYLGAAMAFLAQLNNVSLNMDQFMTLVIACTAASMSSASVPGAAIILVVMICDIISIPTDDVGLLLTVDWFLDRIRSVNNLLGDCYTVAWVQHLSQCGRSDAKEPKMDAENNVSVCTTVILSTEIEEECQDCKHKIKMNAEVTERQKYQYNLPKKEHSPTLA